MKVTEKIERSINSMPDGTTFDYQELPITTSEYDAATKAIERFIKKRVINRASRGVFYKPKKTAFGLLRPKEEDIIGPLTF